VNRDDSTYETRRNATLAQRLLKALAESGAITSRQEGELLYPGWGLIEEAEEAMA
jgi:hypothetical protein